MLHLPDWLHDCLLHGPSTASSATYTTPAEPGLKLSLPHKVASAVSATYAGHATIAVPAATNSITSTEPAALKFVKRLNYFN